jgi:hypothetical protein
MQLVKKLYEYKNGNYATKIYSDGTRIRETEDDDFVADFPDNMDIKITNWCDMGHICKFCHEASHKQGKHADFEPLLKALGSLPAGVEIAIGGGATQAHPHLKHFLVALRRLGLVPNLTINELHLDDELIEKLTDWQSNDLLFGIGLSRRNGHNHEKLYEMSKNKHAVVHLIAGVDGFQDVFDSVEKFGQKKFLVLGYKDFRKGKGFRRSSNGLVEKSIEGWKSGIESFVDKVCGFGGVVSFDNLALKQLDIRAIMSDEEWEQFYQGDDGSGGNLYLDAVKQEYAKSSRSSKRFPFDGKNIIEMYKDINCEKSST